MQTHGGLRFNKSTAASQAGGLEAPSEALRPPTPAHPRLFPTHPARVASPCGILPLSGCSIMQIHCLLFTVSVTISRHESQQGPGGGPRRVTGREAEEETLRRGRQESESLCAKIKARHRETEIFFFIFFSRLLIPHLHIFLMARPQKRNAKRMVCKPGGNW